MGDKTQTVVVDKDGCLVLVSTLDGGAIAAENSSEDFSARHVRTRLAAGARELLQCIDTAIIVGCGGTGWHVAQQLALSDMCRHLVLYDRDTIGIENLNRISAPPVYIGCNKALALKAEIHRFRPSVRITVVPEYLAIEDVLQYLPTDDYILATPVFIYDCTDDPAFQHLLSKEVNKYSVFKIKAQESSAWLSALRCMFYVRCSYNGLNHITITNRTNGRVLDAAIASRYAIVPSYCVPAMFAATFAIYYSIELLVAAIERLSAYWCDFYSIPRADSHTAQRASELRSTLPRIRIGTAIFDLSLSERSKYE